jgi:hypothetical protein
VYGDEFQAVMSKNVPTLPGTLQLNVPGKSLQFVIETLAVSAFCAKTQLHERSRIAESKSLFIVKTSLLYPELYSKSGSQQYGKPPFAAAIQIISLKATLARFSFTKKEFN